MKTDTCCREPINDARVARSVQIALCSTFRYLKDEQLLQTLLEQGVLNQKEVNGGVQIVRAIVLTTTDGDIIVVDEQGKVL